MTLVTEYPKSDVIAFKKVVIMKVDLSMGGRYTHLELKTLFH